MGEQVMNYKDHAMTEFRAANWIDDRGMWCDEMQKAICIGVLKLLEVFHEEGHSGSTAPYAINMFEKLANFKPIVPLTGEDWEWNDVSHYNGSSTMYQNKRCSHVFKDADGRAYDGNGKVFWEWYTGEDGVKRKSHYSCRESRVYIEFPYTPTTEYVYRESGAEG
jgi:hypothetical protein